MLAPDLAAAAADGAALAVALEAFAVAAVTAAWRAAASRRAAADLRVVVNGWSIACGETSTMGVVRSRGLTYLYNKVPDVRKAAHMRLSTVRPIHEQLELRDQRVVI